MAIHLVCLPCSFFQPRQLISDDWGDTRLSPGLHQLSTRLLQLSSGRGRWCLSSATPLGLRSLSPRHITSVLVSLHWLPVRQRIIYKLHGSTYMIQTLATWLTCVCRPIPCVVASNCIPRRLGLVPRTRTATGQRSFAVNGPRTWNSLPAELRTPDMTLCSFKRHLKAHLFQQYVLLLGDGFSTVHPAPLWLFSEFDADYKYSDLLTYLLAGQLISCVNEMRYLGTHTVSARQFKCSLSVAKRSFYRATNAV